MEISIPNRLSALSHPQRLALFRLLMRRYPDLKEGDLRLLSAPVRNEGNRWLVPVDGVPRLLGPLLGVPVDWRPAQRVLVLGRVSIPKVSVTAFSSADLVRVVFDE